MTNSYITFLQNQGNTPHAWANLPGFLDALNNRNPDTLSVVAVPGGTSSTLFEDEWDPYAVPDVAFCFEGTNLWYTLNGSTSWAKVTAPVGSGGYSDEPLLAGEFTSTAGNYRIFAQTGSADDLVTINGGVTGDVVKLKPNPADTITVKHGTGNITLLDGNDFTLATPEILELEYDGANWIERQGSMMDFFRNLLVGEIAFDNLSAGQDIGDPAYDSGWFAVANSTTYTKAHGLSATPRRIEIYHSAVASPGSGDELVRVTQVEDTTGSQYDVLGANGTNVYATTGTAGTVAARTVMSKRRISEVGFYRIQAWV